MVAFAWPQRPGIVIGTLCWAFWTALVMNLPAGEPPAPYFGIQVQEVSSPMARRLGIRADQGVMIAGIWPDSPCARAGFQPGDIVIRFGGVATPRIAQLATAMGQAKVGVRYRIEFTRQGRLATSEVVAGQRPPPPPGGYPVAFSLGLEAVSAGSDSAHRMGIESPLGTAVTRVRPGGAAFQAGLRPGDLIVELAGQQTHTFEDYQAIALRCPLSTRQPLTVVRGQLRWSTAIAMAPAARLDWPRYYAHRQDAYRFQLLPEWQVFRLDQPKAAYEERYDRVLSIFAGYELRCYHSFSTFTDPDSALEQFLQHQRSELSQGRGARDTVGPATAAWVALRVADEPDLVYRIALVHEGRLYRIDALAPVLSDPQQLPLPIVLHLETLQFRPREDGALSQSGSFCASTSCERRPIIDRRVTQMVRASADAVSDSLAPRLDGQRRLPG